MIFVDRGAAATPTSLEAKNGTGQLEYEKAEKYFTSKSDKTEKKESTHNIAKTTFKFKAYKGEDIVVTLETLFHRKCAYCESHFRATGPVDVEHYRPKGGVEEDSSHPGYWWLAAKWTNLLPSCNDCNRRRKHRTATLGMNYQLLASSKKQLSGKLDAFPIRGKKRAACPSDDLDSEDPLLIDPTRRNPKEHITWGFVTDLSVALPIQHQNQTDPYGEASIRTFGLNRQGLVEERTDLLLRLKYEHQRLKEGIEFAATLDTEQLNSYLPLLEKDFAVFVGHGKPDQPYSACALTYIDASKEELVRHLLELKA